MRIAPQSKHMQGLHLPESLAEPWSAMTLGRPGTGCVVRYQTAWSTSVAWTLLWSGSGGGGGVTRQQWVNSSTRGHCRRSDVSCAAGDAGWKCFPLVDQLRYSNSSYMVCLDNRSPRRGSSSWILSQGSWRSQTGQCLRRGGMRPKGNKSWD